MPGYPSDDDPARWVIGIAPVEMLGTGEPIHLVAKNPIAIRREEMKNELRHCQTEDDLLAQARRLPGCGRVIVHRPRANGRQGPRGHGAD
jgi:hypothetical protein